MKKTIQRLLLTATLATVSTAWAEDPKYPDGLIGQVPVITRISAASPYSVPAGKNLYIVSVAGVSQRCGMLDFSCYLAATGATNLLNPYFAQPATPIIVGEGIVLRSTASAIAFDINGFLVDAQVPAVLSDLPPGSGYTVPSGKNLYLMRLGVAGSPAQAIGLSVNGVKISPTSSDPILIGSGQTIANSGGSAVTLIGYLKPQ